MILTIIAFIIILTILVVVHEYGHFLFARILGVKVNEFAIGFGPKLFTWLRKNGTDFNVRVYPLGGFVSMAGESLEEMDVEGGFQSQPPWKRFLIVFAGPLFSFLLAVVIFIFIGCIFGFPTGKISNKIQMVMPQTKANTIGLKSGDVIESINGIKAKDENYVDYIHNNPDKEINLEIKRGNKTLNFKSSPDLMVRFGGASCKEGTGELGVVFDTVSRDSELYKKGIMTNDILLSVNGIDVNSTRDLKKILDNKELEELTLVVSASGKLKTVTLEYAPYYYEAEDLKIYFPEKVFVSEKKGKIKTGDKLISINGNKIKTYKDFHKYSKDEIESIKVLRDTKELNIKINKKINWNMVKSVSVGAFGFMPAPNLEKTNVVDSVKTGSVYIGSMISELCKVLTSREIKDNVGGPIAIVSATNSAVNSGMFSLVILLGGLSLSLAILNLLPIPVLDGGHIFIMFLEFIRRKRFTKEQLLNFQLIGMLIIIFIFVAVMYSDISKLWTGGLPK